MGETKATCNIFPVDFATGEKMPSFYNITLLMGRIDRFNPGIVLLLLVVCVPIHTLLSVPTRTLYER